MASTSSDISLNAVDTDAKVDDIDNDIAATISEPEVPKEESQTESVAASALIATEETAEPKADASTTAKTSSIDTAKSLNESNNKIIKELDDETTKTFPQVLMEVLTNDEDSDTISWLPHGRSFIIYKKKKFASQVLVKYFKATKFTSFTRKLNRWGFTRVTRGPEMGSYFHKLFLRDNPELCLRMSSITSSKYHHDPTNPINANGHYMNGHIMMTPGGFPGFIPVGGFGVPPMMPFPFYGMPPPGTMVAGKTPAVPPTPAELSQQNQYINQQLQQLQWQQFQLQQFQQQQIQASQQANASAATTTNVNNGPGPQQQQQQPQPQQQQQQPPSGMGQPLMLAPYPSQQLQAGSPGNVVLSPVPGTQETAQQSTGPNQGDNGQHTGPAPHPGYPGLPQQQQIAPRLMPLPANAVTHSAQQQQQHQQHQQHQQQQQPQQQPQMNYQHQHQSPVFGHNQQYPQYGQQQQAHPGHSPSRPHQGGNNGANPPHMGNNGGHQHPYPYQYPQQQSYHNPHPQYGQQQQYHPQQQAPQQHPQEQHFNPPLGHPRPMDPMLNPGQLQPPTPDVTNGIAQPLVERNGEGNEGAVVGATEVVVKGGEDLGV